MKVHIAWGRMLTTAILSMVIKMARQARETQKSTVFSIKQTTSQNIFRDKKDREAFVSILKATKDILGYDIYAYCLLDDNEFWLILNAKNHNIAKIMQSITIRYALYREDVSNLFESRYKSKPISSYENLEEEVSKLKSDQRYESCAFCFYHPLEDKPLEFISLLDEPILIDLKHQKRLDDKKVEAILKSKSWENVNERNDIIRDAYANYNISQRQLATYFNLSNSSISKILSTRA